MLLHQAGYVAPVEKLHRHIGVELAKAPHLVVLLGDKVLAQRRQLYEDTVVGQVEVGPEGARRSAVGPPGEDEFDRFVLPGDLIEVEELREEPFRLVAETDGASRPAGRFRPPPSEAVVCRPRPEDEAGQGWPLGQVGGTHEGRPAPCRAHRRR